MRRLTEPIVVFCLDGETEEIAMLVRKAGENTQTSDCAPAMQTLESFQDRQSDDTLVRKGVSIFKEASSAVLGAADRLQTQWVWSAGHLLMYIALYESKLRT